MKILRTIAFVLSILSAAFTNAQVDYSHTELILPGNKDGLQPFYAKLFDLQNHPQISSNVNILHIGGSHVQAGMLSNAVRMHFTPTGDRGLLFPFRAIRTNGSPHFRFDYTGLWRGSRNVSELPDVELGLAGAAAITSDKTATLTLRLRDEGLWDFTTLLLLGEASDPTVTPYIITSAGDTLLADPVMSKIQDVRDTWSFRLLRPDSLVTLGFKGLKRTVGPKVTAKTYKPFEDDHYFIVHGLIPQTGHSGVTYQESGVNGASLPSWLRCSHRFEEELSLLAPDLVIFGIGINDANVPESDFKPDVFKENYRQLIRRIQSVNPDCCFLWITNNDCAYTIGRGRRARKIPNPNTALVQQAMKELAQEYNGAVFDVYALMGGLKSSIEWNKEGLMQKDRIHFTRNGYELIGNLLFDAIDKDYHRLFPQ